MIETQYKIADTLLTFLLDKNGRANIDEYSAYMEKAGYSIPDIIFLRDALISSGFIEYRGSDNYFIALTLRGGKAARYGIEDFLDKEEQEKREKHISGTNVHVVGDNYGNYSQTGTTKEAGKQEGLFMKVAVGVLTAVLAAFIAKYLNL
ncbi:hypothetical protein RCC89_14515 [Cytophagaceae bacterium ABcell3]|nr:hypothetical protein RCC89_14515 [Cytophagaceae bacterium ABcell3]